MAQVSERPSLGAAQIVVIGAGLAGLRTVEELRSAGYQGAISLIGAERRPPYDRPPLSKQLLAGAVDDTSLRAELDSLDVLLCLGERAEGLTNGTVVTDQGEHDYERLVIATGARPIALPGPGRQRFLRTIDDALELRAALLPGTRLAIIGPAGSGLSWRQPLSPVAAG